MANKKKHKAQKTANTVKQEQPAAAPKAQTTTAMNEPAAIWSKAFTFSLLTVFVLMGLMSFGYGLSGDEVDMNEYGKAILKYFTSFGADDTVFNMSKEYDRDGVVIYYGGFFDLICAVVNKFSPFAEYTTRHILNAWAGFIAIFFSARIVAMITDKRWATHTVWLMFLAPFFLGHAMNNPKDIPLAAGYIAAVFFTIRFFERYPNVKFTDYLWLILSIGITINVRVAGILLIPYLFVYVGILYFTKTFFTKEEFKWKDYTKPILIVAVLGYLAGSLLWPYGQKNPISNPLEALSVMSDFKINLAQIWEGEKVLSGELPSSYLIKSFFITNTYALIIGLLAFLVLIRATVKSEKKHIIYFVAFTAFFPLFYIIYKKSNVYHAWRHVLFIFPSVVVIATLGWSYINNLLARQFSKPWLGLILAGVLLIEPILFIIPSYPNTVTYHNQFVGGVEGAYGNYEVDYYYNSVKQCADWLKEKELPKYKADDTIVIASNAVHLMFPYMAGYNNVKINYVRFHERDMQDWDYAIFHIALISLPEIQSEKWQPAGTIFTASVKDKPLSVLVKRTSTTDVKGYRALQAGNKEQALAYFREYVQEDSSNAKVLGATAQAFLELGNIDSATYYASKAHQLDNSNIETKNIYATTLMYGGDSNKAYALFKEVVAAQPNYIMGYYYMATIEKASGNSQAALNNFNKVASAAGQNNAALAADCYKQMGDIFKQQGDIEQANKMYQLATAK